MDIYQIEGEYTKSKAHNPVDFIVFKRFSVKVTENFCPMPREE
ncbi:hypothetical protein [Variovorax sp. S12S4]|nr:hypothetical protein [Variovorax sp. S12S4]